MTMKSNTEILSDILGQNSNPHFQAWCAIVDVLDEVAPGWQHIDAKKNGIESAVATIRKLAGVQPKPEFVNCFECNARDSCQQECECWMKVMGAR